MAECYYCGKEAGHLEKRQHRKRFCNHECRRKYRTKIGHDNYLKLPIKEIENKNRLVERARQGNIAAQALLRQAIGLRGLWNPERKEMVRW